MQNGQTLLKERLRRELHKKVDKQFQKFGVTVSPDMDSQRHKADDVILSWLTRSSAGPPQDELLEYGAIAIVSRLAKWIPEGGLDDKIMPFWMHLFDRVVAAGVDEQSLVLLNRQIAESILSPVDVRAREWVRRG